ncbi:AzlD domain-containing protein [Jeotgalibaca sp. A127]|uniref:AzlD domain-containing protein n=1 Tax=Jeotgalibaca sp. A127 TaxID=3457324 RepID=UPI003FD1F8E1
MSRDILIIILGSAIVTYLPRFLPILAFKDAQLPTWFQKWMGYLPISIFAALIATDVFFWEDYLNLDSLSNLKLIPSVVTVIIAYKTKSMIYSILGGVLSIALLVWLT